MTRLIGLLVGPRLRVARDRAGLDEARPLASWPGVTTYLPREAIDATLRDLPPCSPAVTDVTPEDMWERDVRVISTLVQRMALDAGEPWISPFTSWPRTVPHGLVGSVENQQGDDMYARVARWTGCDQEAISRNVAVITEHASSGPPEGVPSKAFQFLTDKANGTVVAISFYETEEDMRTGDEVLNSMDPAEPMGTRVSVDMAEVAVDVKGP